MEHGDPILGDDTPLKRVLIIAYYWPPAGGPGVQRWLKFSKYLPENGWQPTLLVPDGAAYPVIDESLLNEVPEGINIERVPIFEPYDLAIRFFQGRKKTERLGSISSEEKLSLGQKLMLWARGNLLIPDPRVLWRRRARKRGMQIWKKAEANGKPFHALVTTGPPHSVHLIGLDLKRKLDMPWLADFRDLWREMDYLEDFLPTKRTKKRHEKMERAVVNAADQVSVPTPGVAHSLTHQNPTLESKFNLIHNGWDPGDMDQHDPSDRPRVTNPVRDTFHIGHFGSLFPTRNTPGLWTAIRQWNSQIPMGRKPVHLNIVGSINPNVRESIKSTLLESEWTDYGYIAHGESIEKMMTMDALLLIQNDNKTGQWAIPGKAFEYLATGLPIGVVTPMPSDLGDLTSEWGLTTTHHQDVAGCLRMLDTLFKPYAGNVEAALTYSRKTLTTKMAASLNHMTSNLN